MPKKIAREERKGEERTHLLTVLTYLRIILQTVIWNSIEFQVFFRDLECVTCLLP